MRPQHQSGRGQQTGVVRHLVSLDVPRKIVVRERTVAGDGRQYRLRVRYRVRTIDVARCAAAWFSELLPHCAHEIVEPDPAVAALPKCQVETKRNRLAPCV